MPKPLMMDCQWACRDHSSKLFVLNAWVKILSFFPPLKAAGKSPMEKGWYQGLT